MLSETKKGVEGRTNSLGNDSALENFLYFIHVLYPDLVRNSSTKKHYIIYSPEFVFEETIYFTLQDLAFSFDRQWSSDCKLVQMDTA